MFYNAQEKAKMSAHSLIEVLDAETEAKKAPLKLFECAARAAKAAGKNSIWIADKVLAAAAKKAVKAALPNITFAATSRPVYGATLRYPMGLSEAQKKKMKRALGCLATTQGTQICHYDEIYDYNCLIVVDGIRDGIRIGFQCLSVSENWE